MTILFPSSPLPRPVDGPIIVISHTAPIFSAHAHPHWQYLSIDCQPLPTVRCIYPISSVDSEHRPVHIDPPEASPTLDKRGLRAPLQTPPLFVPHSALIYEGHQWKLLIRSVPVLWIFPEFSPFFRFFWCWNGGEMVQEVLWSSMVMSLSLFDQSCDFVDLDSFCSFRGIFLFGILFLELYRWRNGCRKFCDQPWCWVSCYSTFIAVLLIAFQSVLLVRFFC